MRLVVGLGNPGPRYAFSRHNVGWLVVDALLETLESRRSLSRYHGLLWGPFGEGERSFCVLKPVTYMNVSGRSVAAAWRGLNLTDPAQILVLFDDVHLPLGRLRLRPKGSAGGQNGMASIIGALGTDQIPRLRVGVGEPSRGELADWVLTEFSCSERPLLDKVLGVAVEAVRRWLEGEPMDRLAAAYNGMFLS